MKKFKIEFSLTLIPVLAVITSALLAAIIIFSFFSSSINIANAHSFSLSSPSPSPLQSQQPLQQQQKPINTNGISITRNPNEQQMIHQPFPTSIQSSPVKSPLSQQQQQQQNQPPHQQQQQNPINTNGINNSNKPDNHLPSTAPLLTFSTEFPEPMCRYTVNPLFCPHYLWASK
jgi:hypothetical protein